MENNNYENRRNKPIHKSQFGEGGKLLPQDKELEEAVVEIVHDHYDYRPEEEEDGVVGDGRPVVSALE